MSGYGLPKVGQLLQQVRFLLLDYCWFGWLLWQWQTSPQLAIGIIRREQEAYSAPFNRFFAGMPARFIHTVTITSRPPAQQPPALNEKLITRGEQVQLIGVP